MVLSFQDDWFGVLHHIAGEHEWADGQCNHGPLVEAEGDKTILQKGSTALEAIRKVVINPRFLNTLQYYVTFRYCIYSYLVVYLLHLN